MDAATTHRLAFAGISTLTVLTWYALPDAVRSRRARGAIKAGLLAVTALGVAKIPEVFPRAAELPAPNVDVGKPAVIAGAVALTAAATAGTVWGEKVIFAAGERSRARGDRCAHTPLAAAQALATAAAALVDWDKLVGSDLPTR